MLADNPTLRADLSRKLEAAEAFGTNCKEIHRLAQTYAQAVAAAATAWLELVGSLQRAVPEVRIEEEGRQVAESLSGLAEAVDSAVALPFRAHYDVHVKPLHERRKAYDRVRHGQKETLSKVRDGTMLSVHVEFPFGC